MKKPLLTLAGGLVVALGACKDNPAAPSTDRVVAGSQQTLQSLITGINAQDRATAAGLSYYAYGDIMARDVIRLDPNETRWMTEFYEAPPDPSDFIGGAQWTGYYTAIRAVQNVLADKSLTSLPAAQQAAARGYVRTIEALEYIRLIEYRDINGIVIQGADPTKVTPVRTKASAMAYTSALLDSALTDLQAGASAGTVPFTVPPGWQSHGDYSQVANLILFNRGLKGKIEVYRALDPTAPSASSAAAAITALNTALSDAPATPDQAYLNKGPWYEFNPNAPENFSNPTVDSKLLVTDNFANSIQPGDARAANIVHTAKQTVGRYSASNRLLSTDPANSANLTKPLPILRNAELYLLRAQAEIALGNLAAATADVNVVHTVEGGLAPYPTFPDAATAIQAVLYEYRYSFALQGPQHLIALREYGLLNQAYVSQPGIPTPGPAADALVQTLPITKNESNAQNGNITPVPYP
jgi:hypothetical protein